MKLNFLRRMIWIAFLLIVPGVYENNYAMTAEEIKIIYPGKGVGTIRLNEPMPAGLPSFIDNAIREGNIKLEFFNNKTVIKIIITSDRFFVAVSALRIKQNNAGDVKRFYGNVKHETIPDRKDKLVLRYTLRGLDFEIDRLSERITAIIIYMPDKRLRLPESEYRQYREQFKQMKR